MGGGGEVWDVCVCVGRGGGERRKRKKKQSCQMDIGKKLALEVVASEAPFSNTPELKGDNYHRENRE